MNASRLKKTSFAKTFSYQSHVYFDIVASQKPVACTINILRSSNDSSMIVIDDSSDTPNCGITHWWI